jgi:prophage DNA circulation protein
MSPGELTQIIGAISVLAGLIGFPTYMQRQKAKNEKSNQQELTHASVAQMLKDERDNLVGRLDQVDRSHETQMASMVIRHEQQLTELSVKWQRQHEADQVRISQLEDEVNRLYRRLYQTQAQSSNDPQIKPY